MMSRWNPSCLRHWDHVVCPQCQNDLDLQEDDVREELIYCANCGSAFEVMTDPFELRKIDDFAPTSGAHDTAA